MFALDREDDPVPAHPELAGGRPGEPGRCQDVLVGVLPEPGRGYPGMASRDRRAFTLLFADTQEYGRIVVTREEFNRTGIFCFFLERPAGQLSINLPD